MFLVNMNFENMDKITPALTEAHKAHLEKEYLTNNLMFGGRKVPRTGGIIISMHSDLEDLELILSSDPFVLNGAASYSITEFVPIMASEDYKHLVA